MNTHTVLNFMWRTCLSSIQPQGCILSLFIGEETPGHPKPENSADSLFGMMQVLYIQILGIEGMEYQDFLDELNYHFTAYSVSEEEYINHLIEWKEIYGRTYSLIFNHQKLIEAAFMASEFGDKQISILSMAAYHRISAKNALLLITGLEPKSTPLGSPVQLNIAELIVHIANQFGIFKENLTVSMFNDFMAGTLSEPLQSNSNVEVAIFLNGLKAAKLLNKGAFKRIGELRCILSSTGDRTLSGNEISTQIHEQAKMDEASNRPSGKHKNLKLQMAALKKTIA